MARELPELPKETTTKSKSYEIRTLLDWLEEGDRLVINERYQRGEVGQYKPQFRTRLVESIIRGFPLPSLLVMQKTEPGAPDELIDGQQRLKTIEAFIKGKFPIEGKHLLMLDASDYDGLTFDDMDAPHKDRIRRHYEMNVNYIDDTMPDWQVYVLINGGLNPLTAAELRKAMFAEHAGYWSIDEYAKSEKWTRYFTEGSVARERGTEMLCRGLMSMLYGAIESGASSKEWLETSLAKMFSSHSTAQIDRHIATFDKVMALAREVLGPEPFRRNNLAADRYSKVSKTMIEPVAYVFYHLRKKYSGARLNERQKELVEAWDHFLSFDDDGFERSLGGNTPNTFIPRNKALLSLMVEVMSDAQPRRGKESEIPPELREQVIELHREEDGSVRCSLCFSEMKDEITIDHIISVDDGGETVLENLQPAHRACNSSKNAKR